MEKELQNAMKVWQWSIAPMTSQADLVLDNTLAGTLIILSQVFLVWSTSRSFRQRFSTCAQCTCGLTRALQQCMVTQDPKKWLRAPFLTCPTGESCKRDCLELKDCVFSPKNRPRTSWCKLLQAEKAVDETGSWPHTTGNSAGSSTWMELGDLTTAQSYAEPWNANLNPASSKGQTCLTSKVVGLSLSF